MIDEKIDKYLNESGEDWNLLADFLSNAWENTSEKEAVQYLVKQGFNAKKIKNVVSKWYSDYKLRDIVKTKDLIVKLKELYI